MKRKYNRESVKPKVSSLKKKINIEIKDKWTLTRGEAGGDSKGKRGIIKEHE